MKQHGFYLVIEVSGGEPVAVKARDAGHVREVLGDVALIAPVTAAALARAGWSATNIWDLANPREDELLESDVPPLECLAAFAHAS